MMRHTVCSAFVALLLAAALAAGLSAPAAAQCSGGEKVKEVNLLGRPGTRFSPRPADTLAELQSQFQKYRADIEKVLAQSGWPGNPDDLFRTVAAGGDAVSARQVSAGATFDWMAYRKGGKPTCVKNVRWAGKKPFAAWEVTVESRDRVYTFVVPQICLNLAVVPGSKPAYRPPPPSCSLSVSRESCEPRTISIKASGTYTSISLTEPAGATSTGSSSWSYQPTSDGVYNFTAVATGEDGSTATCSQRFELDCPDPVCSLEAVYDEETGLIRISSAGSRGETVVTGVTLPDGTSGSPGALAAQGDGSWTLDTASTLPRRAGDYTYGFAGSTTLSGDTATCATEVTVNVPRVTGWVLRGWGARLDTSGGSTSSTGTRDSNNFVNEHRQFALGSGTGFGADLEYRFNRRMGVDFGLLVANMDARFQLDLDLECVVDSSDLGLVVPFVGLNFHLTPDAPVDVYVGPFVAQVMYDDDAYTALGRSFRPDLDDETSFGAVLGIDVPFGADSPWMFTGALRYLAAGADGGPLAVEGSPGVVNEIDIDLDPIIAAVGIAYRF